VTVAWVHSVEMEQFRNLAWYIVIRRKRVLVLDDRRILSESVNYHNLRRRLYKRRKRHARRILHFALYIFLEYFIAMISICSIILNYIDESKKQFWCGIHVLREYHYSCDVWMRSDGSLCFRSRIHWCNFNKQIY